MAELPQESLAFTRKRSDGWMSIGKTCSGDSQNVERTSASFSTLKGNKENLPNTGCRKNFVKKKVPEAPKQKLSETVLVHTNERDAFGERKSRTVPFMERRPLTREEIRKEFDF